MTIFFFMMKVWLSPWIATGARGPGAPNDLRRETHRSATETVALPGKRFFGTFSCFVLPTSFRTQRLRMHGSLTPWFSLAIVRDQKNPESRQQKRGGKRRLFDRYTG
jgi:hypothetical protein